MKQGLHRLLFLLFCFAFAHTLQAQESEAGKTKTDTTTASMEGENRLFETVEVEASVDAQLWRKHLEKNLTPYIEAAAKAGMKPGQYTVNVRFIVNKDGSISNVKALNNVAYGLSTGAASVVRTGPKWTPGELSGRKVRSYHTQPITFVISEK